MKLVETLIVRDEADVVDAQLSYHLNAGVDFVIAVDHGSVDGTTEIIESYVRQGCALRIPVSGAVDEVGWRTQMARQAATELQADWVIAADADEFWIPRQGTIKEILAAVPERFGVIGGTICHFVPRPDAGEPFFERMIVRLVQHAPINDPTSPWRPSPKIVFRADPQATVYHAGYWIEAGGRLRDLPGWRPFDVFHFPCRRVEQWARKTGRRGHAESDAPLGQYVKGLQAQEGGRIEDVYAALSVGDATLQTGIAAGSLVVDVRLRDALRTTGVRSEVGQRDDQAAFLSDSSGRGDGPPIDAAALDEATIVRLQRRIDDAVLRVARLERRRWDGLTGRRPRRGWRRVRGRSAR